MKKLFKILMYPLFNDKLKIKKIYFLFYNKLLIKIDLRHKLINKYLFNA